MAKRRMAATVAAVLAGALVAACGPDDSDSAGAGGSFTVVTSFYPLAEAASRVGGEQVEVVNLTPPGAEPHDIELTPRQVDRIEDADIVLYFGGGFQPAVAEVAQRSDGLAIDLLDVEALIERAQGEHGSEAESAPGGDQDSDGLDPHIWLDPIRMRGIVERVRDALIDTDPEGQAAYRSNAGEFLSELSALDRDFETGLADCERDAIVTAHAAFGYLASRYDLTQDAIAGVSPESEPDPQRLADLADEVQERDITTIFYETLVSPDIAETLAREAGVETAVLNPLEGLTDEQIDAGATYGTVMHENLSALRLALGCR